MVEFGSNIIFYYSDCSTCYISESINVIHDCEEEFNQTYCADKFFWSKVPDTFEAPTPVTVSQEFKNVLVGGYK